MFAKVVIYHLLVYTQRIEEIGISTDGWLIAIVNGDVAAANIPIANSDDAGIPNVETSGKTRRKAVGHVGGK